MPSREQCPLGEAYRSLSDARSSGSAGPLSLAALLPCGMPVALLLDFNAGDAAFLGVLVWKLGFALWVPQLLALLYVLRTRRRRAQSRATELGLLLLPWVLMVAALAGSVFGPLVLLLPFYAQVPWGWWLFAVLLPTAAGLVGVGATHRLTPAEAAARLAPPGPWYRGPLGYALVGVIGLGLLAERVRRPRPSAGQTPHWVPPAPAERARQDSARARYNEARTRIEFDSLERVLRQAPEAP
jgi:hypothetical protein